MLGLRWGPGSTDPATALPEVPVNASPYGFLTFGMQKEPCSLPRAIPTAGDGNQHPGVLF